MAVSFFLGLVSDWVGMFFVLADFLLLDDILGLVEVFSIFSLIWFFGK